MFALPDRDSEIAMSEQLSVSIATIARFHSFAMARQLARKGALSAIYTGLARRFVRNEGIDPARIRTFPWIQTPIEAGQRLGLIRPLQARRLAPLAHRALDRHVARDLPACHAFIALAGVGLESGRAAKARGIAYLCDRSSAHIVVQDRLLQAEHAKWDVPFAPVDPRTIERELGEYEQADAILVPSSIVERSFLDRGIPQDRLYRVPLGVELDRFGRSAPQDPEFCVLFVGQPGVRKGFPYLLQAFARAAIPGARLVVVGETQPETDSLLRRFPVAGLEMTGPLGRADVVERMSRASVLVLPSIEDGFGMVQMEAMACGCPVIVSANAGCADFLRDGEDGLIVPAGDADALAAALLRLYEDAALRAAIAEAALRSVRNIGGWNRYGDALGDALIDVVKKSGREVSVLPG